jgi:hypothetical protein
MSQSVEQHAESGKGKDVVQSCPPPGPKLWSLIEVAARSQPVYRVADGLPIPQLTWTAEATRYDIEPESVGIRADVAAHLDGERAGAQRVAASMRSRLQLARLTAAAYRDMGGNRLVDIAEHLAYGGNESSQIRAVRRDVADGRRRWVAVGAWPWWAVARATKKSDLRGGLPSKWWEIHEVGETLTRYVRTS